MTIAEVIKKYNIRVVNDGTQLACDKRIAKVKEDVSFVKENKADIINYIMEESEAKHKAAEDRKAKIAAIEGLDEIIEARRDLENWHYEFQKSFYDVGGLGVRKKPEYDFDAMYARYPIAAAYLKAESFANASNYVKANIGNDARERIINGDNPEAVIAEMEKEWHEYCEAHIWD